MNENIIKLVEKLNLNSELLKGLSEKNNVEEMYNYSLNVVPGYTLEEFKEFLYKIPKPSSKKLNENDLKKVSGGSSSILDDIFTTADSSAKTIKKTDSVDTALKLIGKKVKLPWWK